MVTFGDDVGFGGFNQILQPAVWGLSQRFPVAWMLRNLKVGGLAGHL
jgi:hypothetical protein